jgi:hypothetical protein
VALHRSPGTAAWGAADGDVGGGVAGADWRTKGGTAAPRPEDRRDHGAGVMAHYA